MFLKHISRLFLLLVIFGNQLPSKLWHKPDSEIYGCVYGKIKGSSFEIPLGCMSKVEFDRYLDNPYQTYNGQPINRDLTFTKVAECIECQ
jgi:hypothetical protein